MPSVSVRQALQYVAEHPEPATDEMIQLPVWELVGRALFDIANSPNAKVRGSMAKATRAQKMLLDRMVGLRRAGTHPVQSGVVEIKFLDLTAGAIEP